MSKLIRAKPAPYSPTTIPEVKSITCLLSLLDKDHVLPDIKIADKFPNIDGYVELIKENFPEGKLEVQIKTLASRGAKITHQCETSFLSYCEGNILPVLLIVVDATKEIAYWIHIDKLLIEEIAPKIKGETVRIHLDPLKIISVANKNYIREWRAIYDKYLNRQLNYEDVQQQLNDANLQNIELAKITSPYQADEDSSYQEIHRYLDYLNGFLDREFSVVKEFFYKNIWKLGVAIEEYEEKQLSYISYPIYFSKNDVQIKRVTKENKESIHAIGMIWSAHFTENPILQRPKDYAYEHIRDHVKTLFENNSLWFINDFLADEYLINFIQHNAEPLGLQKDKDTYDLIELENAIKIYYGLWIEETGIKLNDDDPPLSIDISEFTTRMSDKEVARISDAAQKRFSEGDLPKIRYVLYSRAFNIAYLHNLLDFKKQKGIKTITRPYIIKQYPPKETSWIWEVFSDESLLKNLEIFFKNLPEIFDGFIDTFFPLIKEDLKFFSDFDTLIINVRHAKNKEVLIDYFYLKSIGTSNKQGSIEIFFAPLTPASPINQKMLWEERSDVIEIQQCRYKLVRAYFAAPEFIYEDTPMHHFVTNKLQDRFKAYFEKRIRPNFNYSVL